MNDIRTEDYNPVIVQGDFDLFDATLQHSNDLLEFFPGEIRQFPQVGAGAGGYVDDESGRSAFTQEGRSQLELDGQIVERFDYDRGLKEWMVSSYYKTRNT